MIKQCCSKSETSADKRTWAQIIKAYPQVRHMLCVSRKLMIMSAVGSTTEIPWHKSLTDLLQRKGEWTKEEAKSLIELSLYFLNDDLPEVQEDGTPSI